MSYNHGPKIVTDGLVLYLDAGNSKSYPGSGNTWFDLSNSIFNGELVNNPIYNTSINNRYFSFNGITNNRLIRIPNNTMLDTQTPSVEVWIKTNNTNQNGFWFEKGVVNSQYSLFQEGPFIQWRQRITTGALPTLSTTTANFINTSKWYQVVGTFISGSQNLYINGILVNSATLSATINTNTGGVSIGSYGGYSGSRGYYYNGDIAIVKVYNRVLSANEVNQNYNAIKGRFSL